MGGWFIRLIPASIFSYKTHSSPFLLPPLVPLPLPAAAAGATSSSSSSSSSSSASSVDSIPPPPPPQEEREEEESSCLHLEEEEEEEEFIKWGGFRDGDEVYVSFNGQVRLSTHPPTFPTQSNPPSLLPHNPTYLPNLSTQRLTLPIHPSTHPPNRRVEWTWPRGGGADA